MICGIGVDLVTVSRIERAVHRFGDRFAERVYTSEERHMSKGQAMFLAGRFAIKEALLKAMGTGLAGGLRWRDIETITLPSGAPSIRCYGRVKHLLDARGIKNIWATLSHDKDHVVAVVLLEGALA